jgi:hypothetical protein
VGSEGGGDVVDGWWVVGGWLAGNVIIWGGGWVGGYMEGGSCKQRIIRRIKKQFFFLSLSTTAILAYVNIS